MKKYIMAVLISLSALQVVALVTLKKDPVYRDARRNGAQTKIELHIADDDGTPEPGHDGAYFIVNPMTETRA